MNGSPDESRQLSAALRAAGEHARPREDCPAPDRIWAAVQLELPADERAAIIDHTVACPSCAEAWRLAMELGSSESRLASEDAGSDSRRLAPGPALEAQAPGPAPIRKPARAGAREELAARLQSPVAWALLSAATLVVAAGLVFVLRPSTSPVAPIERDSGAGLLRSQLQEGAFLPREAFLLRWTPGPDGTRYDVTVTTAALDPIAEARSLERPEYRIPPERLAGLAPGARLLWRVVARTTDGTTLSSATFEVAVR
jgi:hypothetical protein